MSHTRTCCPTEPVDEGTTFVVWRRVTFDASCFSSRAFFRTISFLLTSYLAAGLVSYAVVMPSPLNYTELLGEGTTFDGVVLGAPK